MEHLFLGRGIDRQIRRYSKAFERLFGPAGREFEQANFQKPGGLPVAGCWRSSLIGAIKKMLRNGLTSVAWRLVFSQWVSIRKRNETFFWKYPFDIERWPLFIEP